MGLYGDYRVGSDGWDDGFSRMLDTGDGASEYHIMYAETKPPEGDESDDGGEQSVSWHAAPYDPDATAEEEWNKLDAGFRRRVARDEWEKTWGKLPVSLSERFLQRRELTELIRYPRWLVLTAVHRKQKLIKALSFAQAVTARLAAPDPGRHSLARRSDD